MYTPIGWGTRWYRTMALAHLYILGSRVKDLPSPWESRPVLAPQAPEVNSRQHTSIVECDSDFGNGVQGLGSRLRIKCLNRGLATHFWNSRPQMVGRKGCTLLRGRLSMRDPRIASASWKCARLASSFWKTPNMPCGGHQCRVQDERLRVWPSIEEWVGI